MLVVGREILVQENMVQAMRKAPLSRALAKSREERGRETERGLKSGWAGNKVGRWLKDQTHTFSKCKKAVVLILVMF